MAGTGGGGLPGGLRAAGDRLRELPGPARAGGAVAVLVLAALLPLAMPYVTANAQYWDTILVQIGIATLLALGLNVVVGFAGLLDLGYVAFFAVGAYTYGVLSGSARYSVALTEGTAHAASLNPVWHAYYWLFFFAALAIAVGAGVVLGAPTLRLRGDYLAIVTLGFGEIVRVTANNLSSIDNGPRGLMNIPNPRIDVGGIHYGFGLSPTPYYLLLLGVIVVWILLLRRVNASRVGRAWVAIREDELAAAAMGVPTVRMKLLAFAVGAAVASLGGVIYASQIGFISPDTFTIFNPQFGSVTILAMVIVGGMGGFAGPIVGAALIVFLPNYFRFLQDARVLFFGLALIIVMILRPQGLIPSRRRAAELRGGVRDETVFDAARYGVEQETIFEAERNAE